MTITPRWFIHFRPCSIAIGLRATPGALPVEWSERITMRVTAVTSSDDFESTLQLAPRRRLTRRGRAAWSPNTPRSHDCRTNRTRYWTCPRLNRRFLDRLWAD